MRQEVTEVVVGVVVPVELPAELRERRLVVPAHGQILGLADHVVFNSPGQWLRHRERALAARRGRPALRFGLRVEL